jgi:hypothetical protein
MFGMIALQVGLIDQSKLVAAFQAWTLDKARGLAEDLAGRGDLDGGDRPAVAALVARHLKKHGGEVERSLAAVPGGRSTHERLAQIGDPDILARDLASLGGQLLEQSRWSEAEPLSRDCLTIRANTTPDDWVRYNAMSLLGEALAGQGRLAGAEPLLVQGYDGMKACETRIPVPNRLRLREAAERVVRLYEDWNKPEQATAWKANVGMPDLPAAVFAPAARR